jgi:hypothetical protein
LPLFFFVSTLPTAFYFCLFIHFFLFFIFCALKYFFGVSRLILKKILQNKIEILGCIASIVVGGVVYPFFGVLLSSTIGAFYKPSHKLRTQSNIWSFMYVSRFCCCFCNCGSSSLLYILSQWPGRDG